MTKTQMMRFQAALEAKRHELVREIHSRAGELAIREDGRDLIDQVQSMNQREEAVLAVQWLSRALSEVDAALRAMSEGVYGACVGCGEPISLRRLETVPWASHCIGCQELIERHQAAQAAVPAWVPRFYEDREAA
jgi:DnaK suppressor protein